MRQSKVVIAVVAVLMAAMSVSVLARDHSGVRAPAGHVAPQRHFAGVARIGVVIAAPLYAPLFYPAPSYYYPPPAAYIEQAPTPAYWYFCPELNAYYPYVQECPGVWQPVLPQSSG